MGQEETPKARLARRRACATAMSVLALALLVQAPGLRILLARTPLFGPAPVLHFVAAGLAAAGIGFLLGAVLDVREVAWTATAVALLLVVFVAWAAWWVVPPGLAMLATMTAWQAQMAPRPAPAPWQPPAAFQ